MVSREVDRINADAFKITPMIVAPNARPKRDPERPILQGKGIFDFEHVDFGIELGVRKSYREANDLRALQGGRNPELSIDRKYFPIREQDEPRQGDIVEFPDFPEIHRMEVSSVARDGHARMVISLVQKAPQV